jgi:hypothetical protein
MSQIEQYPDMALYDPAPPKRGRRRSRKGKMPAGLKRYWANKRRAKPKYEIKRRTTRRRSSRRPTVVHRIVKRKYDPFGIGGIWQSIKLPLGVALGSVGHNYAGVNKGFLAGSVPLPMGASITKIGAVAFIGSALLRAFSRGSFTEFLSYVAAGSAGEGFSVPAIEGIARPESGGTNGAYSIGATPYTPLGAYSNV